MKTRPRKWTELRSIALVLSGITVGVLVVTPAGAHVNDSFDHLWDNHIKPLLADPGTINVEDNPVDWTKLKSVPNQFADGVDQGQNLGYGLRHLVGQGFGTSLTIDPDETQIRVADGCGADSAVRKIGKNGNVTCVKTGKAAGPAGFNVASGNTGIICNDYCTEGALTVPAGTYAIWGKITLAQYTIVDADYMNVVCDLVSSANNVDPTVLDSAHVLTQSDEDLTDSWRAITTLPLNAVASAEAARTYSIDCRDHEAGDVGGFDLQLTAIQLGSLEGSR